MTSQINSIYSALAAKTVTVASSIAYGTVTPAVKDLSALPESVEAAMLPCRLLLPLGGGSEQNHEIIFQTFGGSPQTDYTWKITDLLLWRLNGDGIGLASVAADLIRYSGAYLDMLQTFRFPLAGNTGYPILESARLSRGMFEYPALSKVWFWGVEAVLTITE